MCASARYAIRSIRCSSSATCCPAGGSLVMGDMEYFNSGALLINLEACRADRIGDRCLAFLSKGRARALSRPRRSA